jgi:DNA-binding MarR family transcriptional regulator
MSVPNAFRGRLECHQAVCSNNFAGRGTWRASACEKGLIAMPSAPTADQLVGILRDTVVALVRRDGPDLSARQLGVFLTCYLQEGAHTVRGLAADLNVSKPAITRALDRLGDLDLARRKVDPLDRRSVLVQRTLKGTAFLRDLRGIMGEASVLSRKGGHHASVEHHPRKVLSA